MKTLNRFLSRRPAAASISVAVLLALGQAPRTGAEVIYGLTTFNELISFDSAWPGTLRSDALISGLQPQEELLGIDFGPGGALFGVGVRADSSSRLYTINPLTGVAAMVGSGPFSPRAIGSAFGFSFDPVTGQARLVSSVENLLINPLTGVATAETPPSWAPGDAHFGALVNQMRISYSTGIPGGPPSTLYGIELSGPLFRMGSVGGSPIPAASGQMFTIAQVSGTAASGADGFAISPATGKAYANVAFGLYSVDLTSGNATSLGAFTPGLIPFAITVQPVPEPGGGFILAVGLPCLLGLILRAKMTNSERKEN